MRVLRLHVGAPIRLFDGTGGEYRAFIERIDRSAVIVRIDRFDPVEREWTNAPTLVQSIIAADPMDAAVRKATELGVAAIVPVIATRSQGTLRKGGGDRRLRHWRSIAIAACEQCGRNRIPAIAEPVALDTWLRGVVSEEGPGVIAGPEAKESLAALASRLTPRSLVIGPEGGFTESELALAKEVGLVAVHLGPRVLRSDTAAVAALAIIAAVTGGGR